MTGQLKAQQQEQQQQQQQQHHHLINFLLHSDASPSTGEDPRMNQQFPKQDFDPPPPSCSGLDYLEIPAPGDMRYSQDPTTSSLTLESSAQPSPVINLYPPGPPTVFNTNPAYSADSGGAFYPPASHIFHNLDVRPRLGSNTSLTGIAQTHRSTALPHPGAHISARDIYTPATPAFRRATDSTPRSPSFLATFRRPGTSPSQSPSLSFTTPLRMDTTFGSKAQQNLPPLLPLTSLGTLGYGDGTPIKVDIQGSIDKGFFLADNEWTCYRRNYFSCICSYSLSPHSPSAVMTFCQTTSQQTYTVFGFAMSISAVVADSDGHSIELVQHTPKRDKGPVAQPEKVRLSPKSPHHQHGLYVAGDQGRSAWDQQAFAQAHPSYSTEHTFERIQFKQATANNGKRRAAQQYYHLLVELWADVGNQGPGGDQFIKIAFRKSAKMIVRGRSPGHYQSERRGSTSSGPGGSAGSLGYGNSSMIGSDYSGNSGLPAAYGSGYDPRPVGHYSNGSRHHSEFSMDSVISTEHKPISEHKDYSYYHSHQVYDGTQEQRNPIHLFPHLKIGQDHDQSHLPSDVDSISKAKPANLSLPRIFTSESGPYSSSCGRLEGKPSSSGYYASMSPLPAGIHMP